MFDNLNYSITFSYQQACLSVDVNDRDILCINACCFERIVSNYKRRKKEEKEEEEEKISRKEVEVEVE